MTFEITHTQRACWQRRAVARLAVILAAHADLPVITWTVGPAGSCLAGRVGGLAAPAQVRDVFDVWCRALAVTDRIEVPAGDGTVRLRATVHQDHVKLVLNATAWLDDVQDRR